MKKRTLIVLGLTAAMSMSLFGCGSSSSSSSSSSAASSSAAEETAAESTAAEETETEETTASSVAAAASTSDGEDWTAEYEALYDITGDEKQTWTYIDQDYTDEFCAKVRAGVEDYTAEAFPNVELSSLDGEGEVNTQIELAENAIINGIDVMILNAVDSDGCVVICDMCEEAGIPLVTVNADANCEDEDCHAFVGSDHYLSGQLQAEYLIDNVDDSETVNICYLMGADGYTHTTLRRAGFLETLDNAGYNYKLLAELDGEYLRDRGMDITEDWITQFGDEIDVIGSANDEMAMGALQALQAADMADSGIICLGIDANDDALQAVEDGYFGCTIFQDAVNQGKWGAILAYNVGEGKEIADVSVPYVQVTKANLSEFKN